MALVSAETTLCDSGTRVSPVLAVVAGGFVWRFFGKSAALRRSNLLECGVEAAFGRVSRGARGRRSPTCGSSHSAPGCGWGLLALSVIGVSGRSTGARVSVGLTVG
jgi:hypothetical protein